MATIYKAENLNGVAESLVLVVKKAAELCTCDFCVVEGVRTKQRQCCLYAEGRTKIPPTYQVTWTQNSNHIQGRAVDLTPVTSDGQPTWDLTHYKTQFDAIISAMQSAAEVLGIKIRQGADFKKHKDYPHHELAKGQN